MILAAGAACALPACAPASRLPRRLSGSDTHPEGYPTVEGVREFGRRLSSRTDGRLALQLFSGGQLGEERDTLELTILGGIDVNRVSLAPMATIVPETMVPSLPFLFRSAAHMRAALDGPPGQRILQSLSSHGLIGLAFYDAGERSFYTKARAIQTPEDMRGLKIRVQNSDLFVSLMAALGANATPMPYGEVYQALLQGVVDGAENNWPSYESSRHFEAAPVYSLTRHVMLPEVLVMSRRRWDALQDADKEHVRISARESVGHMRRIWDERDLLAQSRLRDAGVTVVEEIDQAAFRRRVEPVWSRSLHAPELRRLADDILSMGAEHG